MSAERSPPSLLPIVWVLVVLLGIYAHSFHLPSAPSRLLTTTGTRSSFSISNPSSPVVSRQIFSSSRSFFHRRRNNHGLSMNYNTFVKVKSNFEAQCTLEHDEGVSLSDYMRLPVDQYVCIKMPLNATLERMGGPDSTRFNLTVPPVRFFNLVVSPMLFCDVTQTQHSVKIEARECILRGSPYVVGLNGCYKFKVETIFSWIDTPTRKRILSNSNIFVQVDPPAPFKYFGKAILEQTGNIAMKVALNQIENAFVQALAEDYEDWALDAGYRENRAGNGDPDTCYVPMKPIRPTGSNTNTRTHTNDNSTVSISSASTPTLSTPPATTDNPIHAAAPGNPAEDTVSNKDSTNRTAREDGEEEDMGKGKARQRGASPGADDLDYGSVNESSVSDMLTAVKTGITATTSALPSTTVGPAPVGNATSLPTQPPDTSSATNVLISSSTSSTGSIDNDDSSSLQINTTSTAVGVSRDTTTSTSTSTGSISSSSASKTSTIRSKTIRSSTAAGASSSMTKISSSSVSTLSADDAPVSLTDDMCLVPGSDPEVRIELAPQNSRRIFTGTDIRADIDSVWGLLTDYANLDKVVPSLVENEVVSITSDGGARLRQVGGAKVFPGVTFKAKTVLDVRIYTENNPLPSSMLAAPPPAANGANQRAIDDYRNAPIRRGIFPRPYANTQLPHRDITMQNVRGSGDFDHYQGVWRMQELPDCSLDGLPVTRLTYAVEIRPNGFLPVGMIEGRIASDLKSNMVSIRDIVESKVRDRRQEERLAVKEVAVDRWGDRVIDEDQKFFREPSTPTPSDVTTTTATSSPPSYSSSSSSSTSSSSSSSSSSSAILSSLLRSTATSPIAANLATSVAKSVAMSMQVATAAAAAAASDTDVSIDTDTGTDIKVAVTKSSSAATVNTERDSGGGGTSRDSNEGFFSDEALDDISEVISTIVSETRQDIEKPRQQQNVDRDDREETPDTTTIGTTTTTTSSASTTTATAVEVEQEVEGGGVEGGGIDTGSRLRKRDRIRGFLTSVFGVGENTSSSAESVDNSSTFAPTSDGAGAGAAEKSFTTIGTKAVSPDDLEFEIRILQEENKELKARLAELEQITRQEVSLRDQLKQLLEET